MTEHNPSSSLIKRILTAAGLLVLVAICLLIGRPALVGLSLTVCILANFEYLQASCPYRGTQLWTLVAFYSIVAIGCVVYGVGGFLFAYPLSCFAVLVWSVIKIDSSRHGLEDGHVFPVLAGLVYPVAVSSWLICLAQIVDIDQVIWLVAVVAANDSFAYFVGMYFRGPKLAPRISPKKTISGFAGGVVATVLVGVAMRNFLLPGLSIGIVTALSFIVAIAAVLGDLTESMIKRVLGVKDMGNILPGHGGVLDRVDAIVFAAPVVYLFLMQIT